MVFHLAFKEPVSTVTGFSNSAYNHPMSTHLTPPEVTALFAGYSLGAYITHAPLTAGSVETNIRVTTTQGDFVLRIYENRTFNQVLFECAVLEHLAQHDFPAPRVHRSRAGQAVGRIKSKPYAIFSYLPGEHVNSLTAQQKTQLVEQIARLHRITEGFQPPHTADRWNYNPDCLVKLAEVETRKLSTANAQRKLAWYRQAIARLELPAALPRGVVHADFDPSNLLFHKDAFQALIDFDDANYSVLIYDLAAVTDVFIPAFNHDTWMKFKPQSAVFDLQPLRETVQAYSRIRPLSPLEQRHLFDVCQMLVFVDCLWFYARGDAADFYERRKINCFKVLGREAFQRAVFG